MYYLIIRGKASAHKASYPSEADDEDQVLARGHLVKRWLSN